MTTYEQYMKFGAMLNPFVVNRWPQDGQGMRGRGDCMMNIGQAFNGFGKWHRKRADILGENEGIAWSK